MDEAGRPEAPEEYQILISDGRDEATGWRMHVPIVATWKEKVYSMFGTVPSRGCWTG